MRRWVAVEPAAEEGGAVSDAMVRSVVEGCRCRGVLGFGTELPEP